MNADQRAREIAAIIKLIESGASRTEIVSALRAFYARLDGK
jgi:hypothetical protein